MSTTSSITIDGDKKDVLKTLTSVSLFSTGFRTILVRALGPVSSVILTLLLARSLGPEGTGYFYVTLTFITACSIISKFGLETALQRFVGTSWMQGDMRTIVGVYQQAMLITSFLALVVTGLCYLFASTIAELLLNDPGRAGLLRTLSIVILPFSLLGIHSAMLKAVGKPAMGGFFEAAAWPFLSLVLAVITLFYTPLTIHLLIMGHLFAAVLAIVCAYSVLRYSIPDTIEPKFISSRHIFSSCLPLTGVELINYALLWVPFLLLPILSSATEAGLYNVSHRVAAQLGLLMIVFSSMTAPRFAAHHQQGSQEEFSKLAGETTRIMLLCGLPLAIVLIVWSDFIMSLFGTEFRNATGILHILVIAQLVNLATGPVGHLLAMTKHERTLHNVLLSSSLIMLPLSFVLIPLFGASGAAWAVAITIIFNNLVCCHFVAKRLNLPYLLIFAR